jgi:TPR repeat protein
MGEEPGDNKSTSYDNDFPDHGINLNARFKIPDNELSHLMLEALRGDPDAALKIMLHFSFGLANGVEGHKWRIIGAENGHLELQYSLASVLVSFRSGSDSKTRGIFWLWKMAKQGYRTTENWLRSIGFSIEDAQPPDDSLFFNDYTQINESQLEQYTEGALKGNKRAAWVLGDYYYKVRIDSEFSEYWYRIGAQNGSPECQVMLGQIMSSKADGLDQARGEFWLSQAEKN